LNNYDRLSKASGDGYKKWQSKGPEEGSDGLQDMQVSIAVSSLCSTNLMLELDESSVMKQRQYVAVVQSLGEFALASFPRFLKARSFQSFLAHIKALSLPH
jgi:hypothetical protein